MVKTTDGFEIAEEDLKLRGPGDMMGTQQSGILDLKIADIVKDNSILIYARQLAERTLNSDPELSHLKNKRRAMAYKNLYRNNVEWNSIS